MLRGSIQLAADLAEAVVVPVARWSEAPAQSAVVRETAHRPWPLSPGPWVQAQTWRDLLFAHWAVSPDALRGAVPAELPIDTFDGHAWVAVTPFEVTGLRVRGSWPVPRLSRFPETNVRTYTTVGGKPGVYFFSLDAATRLGVMAARRTYRLPYFHARMSIDRLDGEIAYATRRVGGEAALRTRYRPTGALFNARPGTLEHFIIERYCLYTVDDEHDVWRAEIHHPPWPLRPAEAEIELNTMTGPLGLDPPADEAVLHFSARQDVVIWAPRRVA